ncbi:hypothetical protein J4409_02370 [Candidatus Woesearchaeota archaeon]|nr:hypothetical protein [Candidatus Woesearchaeota archaeon]
MKRIIKSILPSLREKKRYLAYEVISDKSINERIAKNAINSYILKFLGELNYAKAGVMFLNFRNNKGVIKTAHNYVNEVKTAIALIDNIENNPVNVKSLYVSGSLSKVFSKTEVN